MIKQFKSLDLAKFIAALLIIVIHTAPFRTYSSVITFGLRNIVCVVAVPFFFVCSGFLLFSKLQTLSDPKEQNSYMVKHIKRLLIMYLIWSLVYLPFVIYKWTLKTNPNYLLCVLEYAKDFFFEGSYLTIWFLPALIFASILVFLLRKKLSFNKIFIISLPFYIFAIFGSSYFGLTIKVPFFERIYEGYYYFFDSIKNGLLFGFLFVTIGGMFTENDYKMSWWLSIGLLILFFILFAVEEFIIAKLDLNLRGVDTTLFLVPLSFLIFYNLLHLTINWNDSLMIFLRKMSMLMFLTQRIPISIIELFFSYTIIYTNSLLFFFTVLSFTFGISFMIILLSKKMKFLKYAY